MGIIELKNIVKTFPSEKVGEGVHAVRDVSLTIEEGDNRLFRCRKVYLGSLY